MTIKVFEMFAGYGGASFALKRAGIPFECIGYSEIDKYACKVYEMNHGAVKNYGDANSIDAEDLPDFDLLTGGFPCQPFSVAGKGLGCADNRGLLVDNIIRVLKEKKPKYFLLENVKGLISKKNKSFFDYIIKCLIDIGYSVHWKVLNSKDFGVPQNRERVWIVGELENSPLIRHYDFPLPITSNTKLVDILEDTVDTKYYVKQEISIKLLESFKNPDAAYCIDANYYRGISVEQYIKKKRRQLVKVCPVTSPDKIKTRQNGRRFKNNGEEAFTLTAMDKHGVIVTLNSPVHSNNRVYDSEGISPTINTAQGGNRQPFIVDAWFIRRLTPTECFRLQGFTNDEIILTGVSDTQRYKLAGNGWDINVASLILKNLL